LRAGGKVLDCHIGNGANQDAIENYSWSATGDVEVGNKSQPSNQHHEEKDDDPGVALIGRYRPIHGAPWVLELNAGSVSNGGGVLHLEEVSRPKSQLLGEECVGKQLNFRVQFPHPTVIEAP